MTDNYKFDLFKTKPEKLTRWDADWYKSLTDDDCIVCLSERQIYLIRMMLEPLTWVNTRWVGDIADLDFDLIKSELQFALDDKMTCENLTTILLKINDMEDKINYVYNQTVTDSTDPLFDVNTTTISDNYSQQQLADFGVQAATCDDAGKDAIYGAVSQLVRYISQNNTDFLENIEQSVGNVAEQASTLLAAFPPTNFLAIDDIADFAQFLVEELLEEYNATVDEALLQETICDLYCLAVNNNCSIDFNDILYYFGSKLPNSPSQFLTSWSSLIQFAIIGSFAGNEYFYYMCFLQLLAAGVADGYNNSNPMSTYALQLAAGLNSPDHDWSIFCTACPTYTHWQLEHDFALGLGDFTITTGTQQENGIKAITGGGTWSYAVRLNFAESQDIENLAAFTSNDGRIGNGSDDFERYSAYTLVNNTGVESVFLTQSFLLPATNHKFCVVHDIPQNAQRSIRFVGVMTAGANKTLTLHKVRVIGVKGVNAKPLGSHLTIIEEPCADFT